MSGSTSNLQPPANGANLFCDASGERRLQYVLHPLATGVHEGCETGFALLVAGGFVRCGFTAKAKDFLVHNKVYVLGKAFNELPCLRKRGASFEGEVPADAGKGKEFAQRPADPEVFLDTGSIQSHRGLNSLASKLAVGEIQFQEGIHEADTG